MFLIDGQPGESVPVQDRGLAYGDGLFETIAVRDGRLEFWHRHLTRLSEGATRLGIPVPAPELLLAEARALTGTTARGVLKLILTRGEGGRGYRPPAMQDVQPRRILGLYPWPEQAEDAAPFNVRLCTTRLSCNPLLAGIKHLNRLEQVLARQEWSDVQIQEGLMLDTQARMISGTMMNVFIVRHGRVFTPDLSECGIAGIVRQRVLELAVAMGLTPQIGTLSLPEVEQADELFFTNSVLGLRTAARFGAYEYSATLADKLAVALQAARVSEAV